MTIFKDPEDINFIFYGAIAILAVVGSLFWGTPVEPNPILLHKHTRDGMIANASKPMVCDHPDTITDLLTALGEAPTMTFNNVSPTSDGRIVSTIIAFGVNSETGTWSLVEFINPDWACIIGNGKGVNIIVNGVPQTDT